MNYLKLIEVDKVETVYYEKFSKNYVFPGEEHNFWEFVYLIRGELEIVAGNRTLLLREGEIIFHKPNEFHSLKSKSDIAPNVIIISFYCNSTSMKIFEQKKYFLPKNLVKYIYEVLEEASIFKKDFGYMYRNEAIDLNKSLGTEQLLYSALETFLVKLIRYEKTYMKKNMIAPSDLANRKLESQDMFENIVIFLNANLDSKINVDIICKKFHISSTKLKNMFKEKMDCGVITYFNLKKMEKAKELIGKKNYAYTEIATMLGFESIHYFSQSFKKKWGMSPSEYEKILENNEVNDFEKN
ncbi:MAG: helix-turn-helix domain-containing protein [Lachnospirales bacterium]